MAREMLLQYLRNTLADFNICGIATSGNEISH
jgi:hypothetical protein